MNFAQWIPLIFILIGVFLLWRAYLIGVRKNCKLISGLDDKILKRINNVDKLMKDYSKWLVLMAFSCFVAAILMNWLGVIGNVIGLILIMITSINLNRVTLDMNTKIKKRIY